MCDPLTLALTALSAVSAKSAPKPPKAVIPAAPIKDADAETGAEVILGGDRDSDATKEEDDTLTKTTAGSGLNAGSKKTGVSIL